MRTLACALKIRKLPALLILAGLMIFAQTVAFAAAITSAATGNWSATATWVGGVVPGAADNVTIASGHTVTMDANATIASLTITGTLQFTSLTTTYTLTLAPGSVVAVNGTLDAGYLGVLQSGASGTTTLTLALAGNLKTSNFNGLGAAAGASFQNQGTGVWDLSSVDANGTVTYLGVGGAACVITDRNYNGLTIQGSGNFTWTLAADRTILGTLLETPSSITLVGTQNLFIGGNFNSQTSIYPGTTTVVLNGTAAQFINHNGTPLGNFVINKVSGTVTTFIASTFNGSFTVAAGTFTPAYVYTINGPFTNNGTTNPTAGFVVNGTFTNTGTMSPTAAWTINGAFVNSGTMTLTAGWNFAGSFTNNGTYSSGAATTTTFNGTLAQTIGGTPVATTFGTLTINNAAGVTSTSKDSVITGLTLQNGVFTLSGPLALGNGATINRYGAGSLSGTPTFGTTVNLIYTNAPAMTPGTEMPAVSTVLNNLTVTATTLNLASDIAINGNLVLSAGATFLNAGTFNITMKGSWTNSSSTTAFSAGSGTVTWSGVSTSIAGTFATTFNNLTVNIGANTLTLTLAPTVNGALTITTGTVALGTQSMNVKGNFTNNSSATALTATTGTVLFSGAAAQTISGTFATTFPNLNINNATGVTLTSNATVSTLLTLQNGVFTLTGALTLGNAATINRYGVGSLSGTPTFGTTVNLIYTNTPAMTPGGEMPAVSTVLNNLTVTATTLNLAADITVNGNLVLSAGATFLNAGTFNITMKGSWTNSSSATAFSAGTGTVTWSGVSTSITGSFVTTFNNLTVNIGANTLTLSLAPTVNGALTITTGTVALGAQNLTINGNFTNNSSATALTASTGTVFFSGAAPQTISGTFATPFPNLNINNATGVTLTSNSTVSTALTLQNGVFTLTGALTLGNTAIINRYTVGSLSATPTFGTAVNLTYTYVASTPSIAPGPEMPSTNIITNLTLSGAVTLNLDRDITVNGTLSLGAGVLAVGTRIVTLPSTVTPGTGSITSSATGTVNYIQTVIGQAVAQGSYGNLTFNNFGKTLSSVGPIHIASVFIPGVASHTVTGSTIDYNGTGPQTIPAGFVSYNNLMISNTAGATLGGNVSVAGDFTNNGLFSGGTAAVTFNSTVAQNILGTSATTFTNLSVNKTAGTFTLGANATVNGILTLTTGNITTGTNSLTIESAGSVVRTSGHIVGNLRKFVASGAGISRIFEVGTAANYTPALVTFANVSVTGYLTGATTATEHPSIASSQINPAKSVNRFWTLTNSGVVFDTYDAVLTFVAGDVDAGAITGNFVVDKFNSPLWSATTIGTRTATTTQALGLTSFSDFAIGEPLTPVITVTGTLTPFGAIAGTPSAAQVDTAAGSYLTDNITITPPAGFELSLASGSGFNTTPIVLTRTGFNVAPTPIYVRLNNAVAGPYSGNITHVSAGATQVNVAVTGTVVASPAPPVLVSPADLATGVLVTTAFSWNTSTGALTYGLQVATDAGFTTLVVNQTGIATTSFTPATPLLVNTIYYWRVNATSIGGTGAWSTAYSFTSENPPIPLAPVLVSPADVATLVLRTASLSWTASAGALTYRLQVATDVGFTTLVINDSTPTTTTYTPASPLPGNTLLYWRVNGKNAAGPGAWSTVWSFTTVYAIPDTVQMVSPANAATGLPAAPAFTWTAALRATTYDLQIASDAAFTAIVLNQTGIAATTFTPVGPLSSLTTYYWRMRSVNNGGVSAYSSPWSFTTMTLPPAPTLVSPLDLGTGIPIATAFQWNASAGATSYALQVATDVGFTALVVNQSGIATTSYTPVAPLTLNTEYFWRVNGSNVGGPGAWSVTRSFRTSLLNQPSHFVFTSATGINATVSIPLVANPSLDGTPLVSGDEIGVYTSSGLCCGGTVWTGANQAITIWGDNTLTPAVDGMVAGQVMYFRLWKLATGLEYIGVSVTYSSGTGTYTDNSLHVLSAFNALTNPPKIENVVLNPGWNLVSSFVTPTQASMDSVCKAILASLVIAKNNAGLIYWPAFGINTIGTWNPAEAYQFYVTAGCTLSLNGTIRRPETSPIALALGWNMIAYTRYSPMSIDSALATIAANVVIVKDNQGLVYWPAFGINMIGSMIPGQGYQIYTSAASSLTFPPNVNLPLPKMVGGSGPILVAPLVTPRVPTHFTVASVSTGANATLLLQIPQAGDGDEVVVRTQRGGYIGAGVVTNGKALVTVWGDNSITTDVIDGAVEGETLNFRLWTANEMKERFLDVTSATDGVTGTATGKTVAYKKDAIVVADLAVGAAVPNSKSGASVPATFGLDQNYPNPFNPATIIRFGLPNEVHVRLDIYNILGMRVASLVDDVVQAGYHEVSFNAANLPSGTYFYRLTAGDFVQMKRMLLLK